jgi:serine/threonine-protein kinase RsbW
MVLLVGPNENMQRGGSKGRGRDERSETDGADSNGVARFEFTIPSDYTASQEIQDKIMSDVNQRGYNSQTVFAIKLALEEAMMNAIKHGNRRDEKKKVHVEASVNSRQAEIVVEDEGPGFNRRSVPDPTLPENLEKCSGRGIHLIEAYAHEVEWSKGGRRVRMVIHDGPDVLPRR